MAKRLNDTDAIVAMPMRGTSGGNESMNIDVRKIDNGYITRETRYSDGGGYQSKETYSPTKPSLNPSIGKGGNLMKGATDYLNKK